MAVRQLTAARMKYDAPTKLARLLSRGVGLFAPQRSAPNGRILPSELARLFPFWDWCPRWLYCGRRGSTCLELQM